MASLKDLPDELMAQVASYCDAATLLRFRFLGRRYYEGSWHIFTDEYMAKFAFLYTPETVKKTIPILELPSAGTRTKRLSVMSWVWDRLVDGTDYHVSVDAVALARLLQAVPSVKSISLDQDEDPYLGHVGEEGVYAVPVFVEVLIESPRTALRELKLENTTIREQDLKQVLRAHGATLRSLDISNMKIRSGSLRNVLMFIRGELALDFFSLDWMWPDDDLQIIIEIMLVAGIAGVQGVLEMA